MYQTSFLKKKYFFIFFKEREKVYLDIESSFEVIVEGFMLQEYEMKFLK